MQINLKDISSPDLRAFLTLLHTEGLHNVVVLGGAVRDMLADLPLRDIDIAVCLHSPAPVNIDTFSVVHKYEILPIMWEALAPLAKLLGCGVNDFCQDDGVTFRNTTVDLLGLVPVENSVGVRYPDIFVDSHKYVFGAYPELTVNRIAINGDGEVWPELHVTHLQERIGIFTTGLLEIDLFRILRALRTCVRFDLSLESQAVDTIEKHLHLLQNSEQFRQEAADRRILPIMREVFDDEKLVVNFDNISLIINRMKNLLSTYARGNGHTT